MQWTRYEAKLDLPVSVESVGCLEEALEYNRCCYRWGKDTAGQSCPVIQRKENITFKFNLNNRACPNYFVFISFQGRAIVANNFIYFVFLSHWKYFYLSAFYLVCLFSRTGVVKSSPWELLSCNCQMRPCCNRPTTNDRIPSSACHVTL